MTHEHVLQSVFEQIYSFIGMHQCANVFTETLILSGRQLSQGRHGQIRQRQTSGTSNFRQDLLQFLCGRMHAFFSRHCQVIQLL